MNEELRAKLIQDLESSGFGSEMRAIKVFTGRQWYTEGGYYYFDKDHRQTREIDISAYKFADGPLPNGHRFRCWYHVVGEVKKSEKAWVIFNGSTELHHRIDAWNNLVEMPGLPFSKSILVDDFSRNSLVSKLGWKGYGIHESFKKPDAPSRWYSSFIGASKAAQHVFQANVDSEPAENALIGDLTCTFVKPVVIFDGPLMAATLSDNGAINIEEVEFAPFAFPFWSEAYEERSYLVDVVRLSSLNEYLEISEQRQSDIVNGVCSIPQRDWDTAPGPIRRPAVRRDAGK